MNTICIRIRFNFRKRILFVFVFVPKLLFVTTLTRVFIHSFRLSQYLLMLHVINVGLMSKFFFLILDVQKLFWTSKKCLDVRIVFLDVQKKLKFFWTSKQFFGRPNKFLYVLAVSNPVLRELLTVGMAVRQKQEY